MALPKPTITVATTSTATGRGARRRARPRCRSRAERGRAGAVRVWAAPFCQRRRGRWHRALPLPRNGAAPPAEGPGGPARHLAQHTGADVIGVDLAEEYVARARRLTDGVGLSDRAHFLQGKVSELPFPASSFDRAAAGSGRDRINGHDARRARPALGAVQDSRLDTADRPARKSRSRIRGLR
ncbi:class I SAM-dependent methyltransferase [Streptomyces sp. NPDC048279]|uniref:class I SAM-dependent methyltransferase n=1 Tax=Streptomyces sp. NPDC048279 TaxID=3154714 RepID=UPI0034327ECD